MNVPDGLWYTAEHEWAAAQDGGAVRVGITDYAQDQLGDVVYVDLPEVGRTYDAGGAVAEIESTKSVAEVYTPFAGEVVSANAALNETPELVNDAPYGDGWIFELRPESEAWTQGLLDAADYRRLVEGA